MEKKSATALVPLLQEAFASDQVLSTNSMCDGFCAYFKIKEDIWGIQKSQVSHPTVLRWNLIRAMRILIEEEKAQSLGRGKYYLTKKWKGRVKRKSRGTYIKQKRGTYVKQKENTTEVELWDLADSLKEVPIPVEDFFLSLRLEGKPYLIRAIKDPFFDYVSRLEKANTEMGTDYTLQNLDQKKLWLFHTTSSIVKAKMTKEKWLVTNITGSEKLLK